MHIRSLCEVGTRISEIPMVMEYCLLSASALWGHVLRWYLLNGEIDQDESLAQEASVSEQMFHNILITKKMKFQGPAIGSQC